MFSIITPAYNEVLNLPALRASLEATLSAIAVEWEWIIVDDGSRDRSYALIEEWAAVDPRIRGARLSRNYGSHAALACGLKLARGDAISFMAADMEDPPEILGELFACWRSGMKVVWAVPQRRTRVGPRAIFYAMLRHGDGMADIPLEGSDVVLIDRAVATVLIAQEERNSSLFSRIRLAGFPHAVVSYRKDERRNGRSGWTLRKKIKLAVDSLTGFDHALVRGMTYVGFLVAFAGFVLSLYVVALAVGGEPPTGWSSIMMVVLILGGSQMIFLGLLGEYAWRTLDEVRGRPLYLIDASTDDQPTRASPPAPVSRQQ